MLLTSNVQQQIDDAGHLTMLAANQNSVNPPVSATPGKIFKAVFRADLSDGAPIESVSTPSLLYLLFEFASKWLQRMYDIFQLLLDRLFWWWHQLSEKLNHRSISAATSPTAAHQPRGRRGSDHDLTVYNSALRMQRLKSEAAHESSTRNRQASTPADRDTPKSKPGALMGVTKFANPADVSHAVAPDGTTVGTASTSCLASVSSSSSVLGGSNIMVPGLASVVLGNGTGPSPPAVPIPPTTGSSSVRQVVRCHGLPMHGGASSHRASSRAVSMRGDVPDHQSTTTDASSRRLGRRCASSNVAMLPSPCSSSRNTLECLIRSQSGTEGNYQPFPRMYQLLKSAILRSEENSTKQLLEQTAQAELEEVCIKIFDGAENLNLLSCAVAHASNPKILESLLAALSDSSRLRALSPVCANNKGYTPLHIAALKANLPATEILLKYQAPVNVKSKLNTTPLHLAVCKNNFAISKALLESGANPNCVTQVGNIPLLSAVHQRSEDLVELLLDFGANPKFQNSNGLSARAMALQMNSSNILALLEVSRGHAGLTPVSDVKKKVVLPPRLPIASSHKQPGSF